MVYDRRRDSEITMADKPKATNAPGPTYLPNTTTDLSAKLAQQRTREVTRGDVQKLFEAFRSGVVSKDPK